MSHFIPLSIVVVCGLLLVMPLARRAKRARPSQSNQQAWVGANAAQNAMRSLQMAAQQSARAAQQASLQAAQSATRASQMAAQRQHAPLSKLVSVTDDSRVAKG